MAKLSKANAGLLATIVAAMANEAAPYHMATEAEIAGLTKEALVETNPEIKDGDKIAVRATEAGVAAHNELNPPAPPASGAAGFAPTAPAAAPAAPAPSAFAIDDGIPCPPGRGGRGGNVYPFDTLNVGQSFHVGATAAKPNPAKSLASTVSSASKRLKPKTFVVRSVDATDPRGVGARVFRTA
jgi:hypothetical protein